MKIKQTIIAGIFGVILFTHLQSYAQIDRLKNLPKYDMSKYHFGFILATNQMFFSLESKHNFNMKKYTSQELGGDSLFLFGIESKPTIGFTIGIVSNLRLGKYFDLRFIPALSFGERYLNYSILQYDDSLTRRFDIQKNITSTFVEFPFHIKYKSKRLNNVRGYLLGGAKYTLDLASNAKRREENADATIVKLKKHDVLFEIGVGFDFYTTYFKFGTELKMSYGIMDMLKREGNIYTDGIERLNSKIFLLSFTFE